jgi:hypothetical protein
VATALSRLFGEGSFRTHAERLAGDLGRSNGPAAFAALVDGML